MPKPHNNRDLERLLAETKKNRMQVEKTHAKVESLEEVIESGKRIRKRRISSLSTGKK